MRDEQQRVLGTSRIAGIYYCNDKLSINTWVVGPSGDLELDPTLHLGGVGFGRTDVARYD